MIKIENLHKSFGDLHVLKGIDLEVKKGEVVAIIGSSGTGKSTLLRCMNYLETPEQGSITIDNVTVTAGKANKKEVFELRKHSAMIFQNYNLFSNMDALHNVMEPLISARGMKKDEAEKVAKEYLNVVGMGEKMKQYPVTLSGGQQQRVAIARSLATKPNVLLFDEPTSALDPEWVQEVLEVIRRLAKEHHTMLIVTHEMQFAKEVADRIIFMDGGKIIEDGTPKQVLENPKQERTREFLRLTKNEGEHRKFGYRIIKSMNYAEILPMFVEAGLEMDENDLNPNGLLTCFELIDEKMGKRVGAATLSYEYGLYLMRSVAIEKEYRGKGLGTLLVGRVMDEAKEWNADSLLITAKEPEFYKKLGFEIVSRDSVPPFSGCANCSRFHNGCESEIMRYEFK